MVNGVTLGLGLAIVAFVRYPLGQEDAVVLQAANVASIGVGTVVRFLSYRYWVFPARRPDDRPAPADGPAGPGSGGLIPRPLGQPVEHHVGHLRDPVDSRRASARSVLQRRGRGREAVGQPGERVVGPAGVDTDVVQLRLQAGQPLLQLRVAGRAAATTFADPSPGDPARPSRA